MFDNKFDQYRPIIVFVWSQLDGGKVEQKYNEIPWQIFGILCTPL